MMTESIAITINDLEQNLMIENLIFHLFSATSTMYVGLNLTYASSFQMLRGTLNFTHTDILIHILAQRSNKIHFIHSFNRFGDNIRGITERRISK